MSNLRDLTLTSIQCRLGRDETLPRWWWRFQELIADDAIARLPSLKSEPPRIFVTHLHCCILDAVDKFRKVVAA